MATEVAVPLPLCQNSAWARGPPRLPDNQGSAPLKWKLVERAPRSQEEAGLPLCKVEEQSRPEDVVKSSNDKKHVAAEELQAREVLELGFSDSQRLEIESNDAQEKIVDANDIACSEGLLEPSASSPCHDVND